MKVKLMHLVDNKSDFATVCEGDPEYILMRMLSTNQPDPIQ